MSSASKVIIYGAGSVAEQLISSDLLDKSYVLMTTDGDECNQIKSIKYLDNNKSGEVIIASQFVKAMKKELDNKSVSESRISVFDPSTEQILNWNQFCRQISPTQICFAYYDLEVNPVSFDVTAFAAKAYLFAQQNKLSRIYYTIVMSAYRFGRVGDGKYYLNDESIYYWKLHNLVCAILAATKGYLGCQIAWDREHVTKELSRHQHIFPFDYHPERPKREFDLADIDHNFPHRTVKNIDLFEKNVLCVGSLAAWLKSKNIEGDFISVTLREYDNCTQRNNSQQDWSLFLNELHSQGKKIVLIRDTFNLDKLLPESLSKFPVYEAASWSIPNRLAIYRAAKLNLACNTGPVSLMYFMGSEVNYQVFNISPNVNWVTSPEFFKEKMGLVEGQRRLSFSEGKVQDLIWASDSLETLRNEFNQAKEVLDL